MGMSPREYASLEVGFTKEGLQIWCKRHEVNVMHIDFQGQRHPAATHCEKDPDETSTVWVDESGNGQQKSELKKAATVEGSDLLVGDHGPLDMNQLLKEIREQNVRIRVEIVNVDDEDLYPPEESIPHIGKLGWAEIDEEGVKIDLDDGTRLYGWECWWKEVTDAGNSD